MKIATISLCCALALSSSAAAQDVDPVAEAARPLAEGVPQVAVVRLGALLSTELSPEQCRAAAGKLADALVASGKADEALTVLSDRTVGDSPELKFARAQALATAQHWNDAMPLYRELAADNASPLHADALMGEAEALRATGQIDEALRTLSTLHRVAAWSVRADLRSVALLLEKRDVAAAAHLVGGIQAKSAAERKEKRLLRGRTEAALGHTEKAIELFSTILRKPEGASHAVLLNALFAIADLHLQAKTAESGDDVVEAFIDHHPNDPELPRIFAKLDELYDSERKPARRELGRWAADVAQPRRSLAQWHLARLDLRSGRRDIAQQIFAQLRASHPTVPAVAEAYLEFARLAIDDRRFDEATAILNEARALNPPTPLLDRINMLNGKAHYLASDWKTAAETFEFAAKHSPQFAADGFFNASLAWLQLRDNTRFIADARELAATGADENTRGDLLLDQGLVQAAQSDKRAAESLGKFVRDFSHHPRVSEAYVALAELAFHAAPARIRDAQKFLERTAESQPNAAATERADHLRIWIADAAPDPNAPGVIPLANEFLQKHGDSALASDVRMKLGEAYFRRQDFASAQTQFELLAQTDPNGPFAQKALFFAAESALQSMGAQSLDRALVLLDQVVKRNGELKWAARNEEAVVERKLGKPEDAVTLYDEVLKGDGRPGEKREALCGKADILYEMASGDRQKYGAALGLYQQLANEPNPPPHWRNQALFKAGMCLEKMDDRPHALDTFYRVLEDEERPDRPREFFWFYKAGFNAARLLEDESQWAPAASIYQKLVLAGGDRSDEAKARLSRLRLEHFLWDQ